MIKSLNLFIISILILEIYTSCEEQKKLPILGNPEIISREVDGKILVDTLEHQIADFSLLNQDSVLINNDSLSNSIYVADFFFTSCPTICPVMKKQLLRVYEKYADDPRLKILSHTIDPSYDNVKVLSEYSKSLGVSSPKWNFLTGDQEVIYQLGEKSYMVTAGADNDAPGGFIHSGAFLLVDRERRVRGVYDGTMKEQVDLLIKDINTLLNEEFAK